MRTRAILTFALLCLGGASAYAQTPAIPRTAEPAPAAPAPAPATPGATPRAPTAAMPSQSFTLRLAGLFPQGSSLAASARAFQSAVNERVPGARVDLLESPAPVLEMVRRGVADMAAVPNTVMAAEIGEEFVVFDLPFLFNNLNEVERVQESPVGVGLLSLPPNSGLLGLGYWNGGMSQLFGRPVTMAEALKGLKVRSNVAPPSQRAAEAVGMTVRRVPVPEIVSALKSGSVDAAEAPPHYVANSVLPIERTTISQVNYRPVTYAIVANRAAWKKLPLRVQVGVAEQVQRTARQSTVDATRMDEQALATLKEREFTRAIVSPEGAAQIRQAAAAGWQPILSLTVRDVVNAAYSVLQDRRSAAPPEPARMPPNLPIFFATDRNEESTTDARWHFGGGRGAQTRYGVVPVRASPDHAVGDASTIEFGSLDLLSKDDFVRRLAAEARPSKRVLVYVHGFNNSFADAVDTAALVAADAKFDGVVAVFSWPSAASVFEYWGDEDEVGTSRQAFIDFLTAIRSINGMERVHVLAHSMGNRLLVEALEWANGRKGYGKSFLYHVVLAAPDVYQQRYEKGAASLVALSHKVTLYASDNDQALACSERVVHGKPRAGQGGDKIDVVADVDTVDATPADPRPWYGVICTPLGHGYAMRNASVLADVRDVLLSDTPPVKRFRLLPRKKGALDYWIFQAAK